MHLSTSRSTQALIVLALALALCGCSTESTKPDRAGARNRGRPAGDRRPIAPFAPRDSLAIVDVHGHLNGDMSAERLVELMDTSGVSRMVLMPRHFAGRRSGGSGSDEQALAFAETYPGRFLPFVAGQRDVLEDRGRWSTPDSVAENLVNEIDTKLRTQRFYGIGELIIRHYAFEGERRGRERDIPVNTPLMGRFAELAAHHAVPLLIHAEGEPDVVAA